MYNNNNNDNVIACEYDANEYDATHREDGATYGDVACANATHDDGDSYPYKTTTNNNPYNKEPNKNMNNNTEDRTTDKTPVMETSEET